MAISSYFRLVKAGWVLMREGVTRLADPEQLPPSGQFAIKVLRVFEKGSVKKANNAERLTQALNRLGPSYIKIGQFLATRPDMVGKEIAGNLSLLQDRLPAFDTAIAKAQVEAAFGKPCDELFESFSEPIAAASIAQVHKATRRNADGTTREVAVKVLRPDIHKRFKNDLDAFFIAARWAEFFVPSLRRMRPVAAVETLERSAELELDLRLEAAALSELGENMEDNPNYRTPDVVWDFMSRDILVTEWIDGLKLSDLEGLEAAGYDLPELANEVINSFLTQAVRDGFFHADPHQGNMFVTEGGKIVAIDGGIMGRINEGESRFLAEILWGFINREYMRIAEVHFEAGYVPARHKVEDFAQALRGIGEPIHGAQADDISMARLLQQLLDVTDLFDMPMQPQLMFLQRTMVVAEGVARSLDPSFNMWKAAEPVIKGWIGREVGPAAHIRRAANGVNALGKLVGDLPELAARAEKLSAEMAAVGEKGLRLDPETLKAFSGDESKSAKVTAYGLWAIAIAVGALAVVMWQG
ncbi:MAG: 2-polyprenylphenol 6-hydroxylase [Hyphomicrobiales bacterium]